ncbi:MAG TPA: metallophosphoesterase [Ktedonobacterales bacterium]|nr:metallophosphoesterase [Ktedonobacterales bacterium]
MPQNIVGRGGRLFGERVPGQDESVFQVNNTSQAYFNSPYYLLHQKQVQPVPAPSVSPPRLNLADVVDDPFIAAIQAAKKIVFHAVGDTGAAKNNNPATEASVADVMAADVAAGGPDAPSFFFHLGDVVYYFGEDQYYYDQFYEPFRAYDRPIFAIPGNHDGVVFGSDPSVPAVPTLQGFRRNFCAAAPGPSPDSGTLVRSAMTQPGVYFTLDAPFVSIIGLYSNVLEGPGVISSQGGAYPIGDEQKQFLTSELQRLKAEHDAGTRAVVLAVHHPPLSVDSKHGGTTGLSNDIDACCTAAGLWPDVVLSGHAHLYQRYARKIGGQTVAYVVSGSGGFAATRPLNNIVAPHVEGNVTLVHGPIVKFGYLTVTVDFTGPAGALTVTFHLVEGGKARVEDSVTVALPGGKQSPRTGTAKRR